MVEDFNISDLIDDSKEIVREEIIKSISNDFHGLDLSFINPSSDSCYVKFKSTEELTTTVFDIIKKFKLEIAVVPLIGSSKIKWYSKSIEKGEILIAMMKSNFEDPDVLLLGVVK